MSERERYAAFPSLGDNGMTLRDWFAGMAITARLSNSRTSWPQSRAVRARMAERAKQANAKEPAQ